MSGKEIVNKKGLLIGINYTGTCNELNGCINDTENLRQFILTNKYLLENEMEFMNDKCSNDLYPSKENMMKKMEEIVNFANDHQKDNIFLFLSYSGHGAYVTDTNGDENDGRDEVLCPIDCSSNGYIIDDDIKRQIIDKLGSNVTLVVLIDACHSGSILDLKYMYNCDKKNTYTVLGSENETKCQVIMISGCRDDQTSADAFIATGGAKYKEYQGAMTASFINCYSDEISTTALIDRMRMWLKSNGYSQIPQVSSGKLIDVTKPFILSKYNN